MLQVNSEFYTGWLDHWGDDHAVVDAKEVSRVLVEMLVMGANVNMYVLAHILHILTHLAGILPHFSYCHESHSKAKTQTRVSSKSMMGDI